jgi:hypothetical protein
MPHSRRVFYDDKGSQNPWQNKLFVRHFWFRYKHRNLVFEHAAMHTPFAQTTARLRLPVILASIIFTKIGAAARVDRAGVMAAERPAAVTAAPPATGEIRSAARATRGQISRTAGRVDAAAEAATRATA